ncbi:MAG: hypothetical protein F6K47_04660 [Symploca sp. SIO2E6]|nr:hypothetical protein [Symploca sp. SIO2E6]
MKSQSLLGLITSLTISGTVPFLATVINPAPAFADNASVIRKVVLFDLFQRGGFSGITPEVTKVTVVDSYGLAHWFWGQGRGETFLIRENEKWRTIVSTSGALHPSTLVRYGIPRDTARTIINLDRGGSEESLAVAEPFIPVLPQLQQQTDVLILLPSEMPLKGRPIYVTSQIGNDQYQLNLELDSKCRGVIACTIGSFSAEPVGKLYYADDPFTKEVHLAKGIPGYFIPSRCDPTSRRTERNFYCRPSTIEWIWEDSVYRISLRGVGRNVSEEEAILSAIANSAIEAGPR